MKIFLDDIRDPSYVGWTREESVIVRNYKDFKKTIERNINKVTFISFDHDLGINNDGTESNGMSCAKLLVEMDLDNVIDISHLKFQVHSANPVGKANIEGYLNGYIERNGIK